MNKMLRNLKFRYKIILIYCIAGFLPLFLICFFMFIRLNDLVLSQEKMNHENMLEQAVNHFDHQLDTYRNVSDYLSYNQTIGSILSTDTSTSYDFYDKIVNTIDPTLNSLQYFHKEIECITIYSAHDIKHSTTLDSLDSISSNSWYKEVRQTNTPLWEINHKNKIAYSVQNMPSMSRYHKTGILLLKVNYDVLFESFKNLEDAGMVIGYNGETIYQSEKNTISLEECKNHQLPSGYRLIEKEVDHWTIYYYYLDSSQTNHSISEAFLIGFIVMILALVIGSGILYLTSGHIIGRIEALENNMKDVEEGKLDVYVHSDDKDEVGQLIRGFEHMVERIKVLISELVQSSVREKNYELRALQQQINPHFLYNTLSMVNFMALECGQEDICKITLALSEYYRTSLNKGQNKCSLGDELKNVNSYIDIELMMHDYNFDYDLQVDPSFESFETINLIIQPVVENAIIHGIDHLENRKGLLKIYATVDEKNVYIMVEDNGVGMDEETKESILTTKTKGYGMRNVNERIQLTYGLEYGLYIESVLTEGTVVTIKLPKILYS